MSSKHLMARLKKLDGVVSGSYDATQCLRTPSPSINIAMAIKGHGLPFGYSMVLYGPPKGGKSVICNAFIGQLHREDPEAVAITFNTEMRGELQSSDKSAKSFGIDPERFVCYDVNKPSEIFDRIETDIAACCQDGLKVKLIIIDSLKGIAGRRFLSADSVDTQQIGDQAATIQDGLMRILPVIRKHKIALVMTTHVRAEMDMAEQKRGHKVKMASAFATQHMAELFCFVEKNQSKAGKTDLSGSEFVKEDLRDFMDNNDKTGHKVRFKVTGNSIGPDGRTGEFTLDYSKGIINQYEEVFQLGKNFGIIEKPNNVMYKYKEYSWRGMPECLAAIKDSLELQKQILDDVYAKDDCSLA
jgi:RecA/RadA recombinase